MKKIVAFGVVIAVAVFVIFDNYLSRPVKVVDVHMTNYSATILVDHLPVTDIQRIEWWKENKAEILSKYKIPLENTYGDLSYYVMAFGDGYKELGKEDRLCFDDIPPPKNCIDKERLLTVRTTRDGGTEYVLKGGVYVEGRDGEVR
ncbi:hypothetical protein J2125_002786 [Erwinia toletana]|uniref:DUF943 family protein n=1 Tax=Winslowiella toletana TaxID=92490 RepID=A0ABS4PAD7_9GAMM|nr:DUF943 family protein [Winslowiella toletana]MBP2169594.1 hypothetical protein [Winslowiella toletana]